MKLPSALYFFTIMNKLTLKLLLTFTFLLNSSLLFPSDNSTLENLFNFTTYHNLKLFYDHGIKYGIQETDDDSYDVNYPDGHKEERNINDSNFVYLSENKGYGIGLQYIIGLGLYDFASYKNKYFMNLGLLFDLGYTYHNESNIYSLGIGYNIGMFWFLSLSASLCYAFFNNNLTYIDHYEYNGYKDIPIYSKRSLSGLYLSIQLGLDLPINNIYDIFLYFSIKEYKFNDENYEYGSWTRFSLYLGINYKFKVKSHSILNIKK